METFERWIAALVLGCLAFAAGAWWHAETVAPVVVVPVDVPDVTTPSTTVAVFEP